MPLDDMFLAYKGINETDVIDSPSVDDYIIPIFDTTTQRMKTTSLGGVFSPVRVGFWDYNDLATTTTPISVSADTDTVLTNDGLGSFTNKTYKLSGIDDIFNTSTDSFDWSGLKLGDTVDIRIDIDVTTTSNNQDVSISINLGSGGDAYQIPFISGMGFKTSGTHKISGYQGVYMGDNNTLNGGGQMIINTDSSATVKVNGWYTRVITR